MKQSLSDILKLGKLSISLPVGITAYTGYSLFEGRISWFGLIPLVGIMFLSASASAINQIQERKADAKMIRTRNRPIPSGRMTLRKAISVSVLFWLTGTLLLSMTTVEGLLWGWTGMAWYNLVYTPLKKVTAFSVFPGALVGAIPPVAGWMAAGGSLFDPRLHFLALFFFLGQMPHFWLLVIKYGKDYKKGGFPTLYDYFTNNQIDRINLVWFVATFVTAILLPINHVLNGNSLSIILMLLSVSMIFWVINIFIRKKNISGEYGLRRLFVGFNSYYLIVMILISLDQINW